MLQFLIVYYVIGSHPAAGRADAKDRGADPDALRGPMLYIYIYICIYT